MGGTAITLLK